MPRVAKRAAKPKGARAKADAEEAAPMEEVEGAVATAVAEAPPPNDVPPVERAALEVPTKPVEPIEEPTERPTPPAAPGTTINIAKLQAMTMPELNAMAKEMAIENFGTMRKHEV